MQLGEEDAAMKAEPEARADAGVRKIEERASGCGDAAQAIERRAASDDAIGDAEIVQNAEPRRLHDDARTDGPRVRHPFEHRDPMPGARQVHRRRRTGSPSADHGDIEVMHTENSNSEIERSGGQKNLNFQNAGYSNLAF